MMNQVVCPRQLKTAAVLFPRIDFSTKCRSCQPLPYVPIPTNLLVQNIATGPLYFSFTFNYRVSGTDYFNFVIQNLTTFTTTTDRYQPSLSGRYFIGGLIPANQYTISVIPVIDGIPRTSSAPSNIFSPGLGQRQYTYFLDTIIRIDQVYFGGTENKAYQLEKPCEAIAAGPDGNPIVAGTDSIRNFFLKKYTTNGNLIWSTFEASSTHTPYLYGMAVDPSGNIFTVGYTANTPPRAIISKWNGTTGAYMTSVTYNPFALDTYGATGVTTDSNGNVYVCGYRLDPSGMLPSVGYFVLKYTNSLVSSATYTIDPDANIGVYSMSRGIAIDTNGNVVITGYQQSTQYKTVYFIAVHNKTSLVRSGKYLQTGVNFKTTNAEAITADTSGNLYVVGTTSQDVNGTLLVAPAPSALFITKYTLATSTSPQWTRLLGPTTVTNSNPTTGQGIACDTLGNIYAIGYTSNPLSKSIVQEGSRDVYIVKYTPAGIQVFLKQYGTYTAYGQQLSSSQGIAIATNSFNEIFISGFSNGARFDGNKNNLITGGFYSFNAFISKYTGA